jgi:sugar lactone lactonase YvrE
MKTWKAPRGPGPYGITTTPKGDVYYASLAGSYIARIDTETGAATVIEPKTKDQGARRVWSDSKGRIWVSYWNTGHVGMYDPATQAWREWMLPGNRPRTYSVWVDSTDKVWLTDFVANAIVRFDPVNETFQSFPSDKDGANVRQMQGRPRRSVGRGIGQFAAGDDSGALSAIPASTSDGLVASRSRLLRDLRPARLDLAAPHLGLDATALRAAGGAGRFAGGGTVATFATSASSRASASALFWSWLR